MSISEKPGRPIVLDTQYPQAHRCGVITLPAPRPFKDKNPLECISKSELAGHITNSNFCNQKKKNNENLPPLLTHILLESSLPHVLPNMSPRYAATKSRVIHLPIAVNRANLKTRTTRDFSMNARIYDLSRTASR